jgi:transcriptional regulator with XRE-family HTH domain
MFKAITIKDTKLQIGSLVKILRKKQKLTQEELANQLNISRITIQNLEKGKNFTVDTLLKVCYHFDILNELHHILLKYTEEQKNTPNLY